MQIDWISLKAIWPHDESCQNDSVDNIFVCGVQNSAFRSYFILALALGFGGLGLDVEGFKQKKNKKGGKEKPTAV